MVIKSDGRPAGVVMMLKGQWYNAELKAAVVGEDIRADDCFW